MTLSRDPEKLREWKRTSKPLTRRTPLRSKSRLKRRNDERAEKRRERDFGTKAKWISQQPCDTCGAPPPSDPDHHPTRGAGGTSEDLWPLCTACHRDRHRRGIETFQERHDVDADERTAYWERRWQEREAE